MILTKKKKLFALRIRVSNLEVKIRGNIMRIANLAIILCVFGACSGSAQATETINYSYDAKGRVVKVVHSGTVNNGVITTYTPDKADNRTNVTTTGASN
jgi:hypothetical protein